MIAGARIVGGAQRGGRAAVANRRAGAGCGPAERRAERQKGPGRRGRRSQVVGVGIGRKNVDGRIAHLANESFLVGGRDEHAECVVEELLRSEHRNARIDVFGDRVVDTAAREREDVFVHVVERTRRPKVDRCAQRSFLDIRRRGLAHRERGEDFCREDVEVEAAPAVAGAVDVARSGLRGAFHAVDAHAGEAGSKTAHGNVSTFTAIGARERHARNALH